MPTPQVPQHKNTPCKLVKNKSNPWQRKICPQELRSKGNGRDGSLSLRIPANQRCCFCGNGDNEAGLDQQERGKDKYLFSVSSFKCFLTSNPFDGLEMKTSPDLGCISFPSKRLVEMSVKLMWLQRWGRTVRTRLVLLLQPSATQKGTEYILMWPALLSLSRDPTAGSVLGEYLMWALGFYILLPLLSSSSFNGF